MFFSPFKRTKNFLGIAAILVFPSIGFADQAVIPTASASAELEKQNSIVRNTMDRMARAQARLEKINQLYTTDIKPIFEKKCFDCHSGRTRYPFYSKLPFVRRLIEGDIAAARESLDLSTDFPFGGHGLFSTDLPKIRLVIEEGDMPPFLYRVMHGESRISDQERRKIFDWVDRSQNLLLEQ